MPSPRTKRTVRLDIQKSVFGGEGLAIFDGKACFVEGALPGETVEAEILQDKKEWARARAVQVIKASPHRISAPCSYYGTCGGCQYQHVSYEEELRMKEAQVREVMDKIAGIRDRIAPILRGPKEYHYRRSATFQVIPGGRQEPLRLAYVSKDNVTPVPVQHCDLLDTRLETVLKNPPLKISSKKVSFKLSGEGKIVSDEKEVFFRVPILGKSLLAVSGAFFQNNWEVTGSIAGKIREWLSVLNPGRFFDLYAGIGTFTFLCAEGIPRIFCVEEHPKAVQALKMACEEAKWKGLEALTGKVERVFGALWEKEGSPDSAIFLDPPRQGLEKKLTELLAHKVQARALLYVSCDPATLARDLKVLTGEGNWKLEELVPFDMFPRTKHVEAAALLLYKGS